MRAILSNLPNWIQTGSAVAIVVFTFLTLLVLRDYAADTKKIAKASVTQVENTEKPFIALLIKPPEVGRHGGDWAIENEGTGPAINIRHSDPRGGGQLRESVRALGRGAFFIFEGFDLDAIRNQGFTAEYESVSGLRYRTVVAWQDGAVRTSFHGPL